jgi:Uma2 family endonuclease
MVVVSGIEVWARPGEPYTVDELDLIPDDGRRYELLDGTVLVSPPPGTTQQEAAAELVAELRAACPPDLKVVAEPAVQLSRITEFDPDIVVIRQEHAGDAKVTVPPLLIVELRSPATALIDLNRKKAAYAQFGLPSYWIVDPTPDRPGLTVFELGREGSGIADTSEYVQAGRVSGTTPFPAKNPFPVEIVPARLVGGRLPR